MNTKPTPKRHTPPKPSGLPSGHYVGTITNTKVGKLFILVTTQFAHLEGQMAGVLAALIPTADNTAAGYILRSIKSPRGRIDLMRDLLTLSPHNADKSDFFDEIIGDFAAINTARNRYVHALWYTFTETKDVYLCPYDVHGMGLLDAAPVDVVAMQTLLEDMHALQIKIARLGHSQALAAQLAAQPSKPL